MSKIDVVKQWISDKNNQEWIMIDRLDMYLWNNHGGDIAFLYDLINAEKSEFDSEYEEYQYRPINKKECKILKWTIIGDVLDIIKDGVYCDMSTDVSHATIKKALKELELYTVLNNMFIDNLNGEQDNIDFFKKHFM